MTLLRIINDFIWGTCTLTLLTFSGIYFIIKLRGRNYRGLLSAGRYLLHNQSSGGVSPFKALMTALSGTVGTGNIAGIAAAVALGGPGVLFYMWMIGLLAIVIKYVEGYMAVRFRQKSAQGYVGGPMYYISIGRGGRGARVIAAGFAVCCLLAALGIGSSVQANSIAQIFYAHYHVPVWISGACVTVAAAGILIGGIERVSDVAAKMVPTMILLYFLACGAVLWSHSQQIIPALELIVHAAFHGHMAVNGFAGATVWSAVYFGSARGIFSNEAGLGSAAIAHATSDETDPHKQGSIASLGTLVDTFFVCTLTGLVVIVSGVWHSGQTGAQLTAMAVDTVVPWGYLLIGLSVVFFGFSTILAWGYYSDVAMRYLWPRGVSAYRILFLLNLFLGSIFSLDVIWLCADLFNGLMAIPNLCGLLLLARFLSRSEN